jgi:hypothetical protein
MSVTWKHHREASDHLLAAAMLLSPTGIEQRRFARISQQRIDPPERTIALLEALVDLMTTEPEFIGNSRLVEPGSGVYLDADGKVDWQASRNADPKLVD